MDEKVNIPKFYEDKSIHIPEFYNEVSMQVTGCTGYCEIYDLSCGQCSPSLQCNSCQDGDCQDTCESRCQYACESYCMSDCESCETSCLGTCLVACQACENQCQSNCQIYCEETCLSSCQDCQGGCQTTCEINYQDTTSPTVSNLNLTALKQAGNKYHIKATWSASDNVGIAKFWFYISPPNSSELISLGYDGPSSMREITFTGDGNENNITKGNTYTIRIRAIDTSGNMSSTAPGTKSIYIEPSRPGNWDWEFTIQSGGNFYSENKIMRALHWNAFTDRINEFRTYKGLSSYNFTYATQSTTNAGIRNCINEAIDKINDMLPSGKMSAVSSGDTVRASIFIDLKNKLNSL